MFLSEKSARRASTCDHISYSPLVEGRTEVPPSRYDRRLFLYLFLEAIVLFGLFGAYIAFTLETSSSVPELDSDDCKYPYQ